MLIRKDAGVVDRGGLENRCTLTGTKGSNPFLSAIYVVNQRVVKFTHSFTHINALTVCFFVVTQTKKGSTHEHSTRSQVHILPGEHLLAISIHKSRTLT